MNFYQLIERSMQLEKSGKRIIKLSIGETNLPTPSCVVEEARRCLAGTKSSYGSGLGLLELRQRIAEREQCTADEVLVGPGSKQLIYALLKVLCADHKAVVLPTPTWPAYMLMCRDLGLESRLVHTSLEEAWAFSDLPLASAGALVLSNPSNPTSVVYAEDCIRKTIEAARTAGVPVILDEAYRGLSFADIPRYDGAIRVRSFSKEFAMEGWRIGYVVAPADLIKKLLSFMQLTITCVPEFIQRAALCALQNESSILSNHKALWAKRVAVAQRLLHDAGFKFATPQAGIYLFATHPGIANSMRFAEELLDAGVAVSPGSEFGDYSQFIRICVNQDENGIVGAIAIMGEVLRERGDNGDKNLEASSAKSA